MWESLLLPIATVNDGRMSCLRSYWRQRKKWNANPPLFLTDWLCALYILLIPTFMPFVVIVWNVLYFPAYMNSTHALKPSSYPTTCFKLSLLCLLVHTSLSCVRTPRGICIHLYMTWTICYLVVLAWCDVYRFQYLPSYILWAPWA